MPLSVRRLFASSILVVFSFIILNAQTAPTSGEVMRGRISKAKAFIAVRNYNAAIYELENMRRETSEQTVHGVLNVLLVNCYLEQGDYKRAQDFLTALFSDVKANKPNAAANYYGSAGQVIKGARNQSDRYKSLGLSVSDRNLPPEAAADLEKMRETLEKLIEQSKTLGKDPKQSSDAFALLEGTTGARSLLARDDFDAKRWQNEIADSREMLANSRSTILNAVNEPTTEMPTVSNDTVASNNTPDLPTNTLPVPIKTDETVPVFRPVKDSKPNADLTAKIEQPNDLRKTDDTPKTNPNDTTKPKRERLVNKPNENPNNKTDGTTAQTETVSLDSPLSVGSLLEYAVARTNPVYPPNARSLRQTGIVRLEVLIDEDGKVATVQNLTGPSLLQGAAKDAVKKWKFKPFMRDGQPVKATGFLSFNFNL